MIRFIPQSVPGFVRGLLLVGILGGVLSAQRLAPSAADEPTATEDSAGGSISSESTTDGDQGEESSPGASAGKTPSTSPAAGFPSGKGTSRTKPSKDVIEVVGPDGKTVRLPREEVFQQFLQWLGRQRGPAFAINAVEMEGRANEERAEITATVTVQILRSDEWLLVPLFFGEGVITRWEHTFLGKEAGGVPAVTGKKTSGVAAFKDATQETGYRWWFRGAGYHRLKIALLVPLTRTVGQRRLRLSLPRQAATGTLQLEVPVAGLQSSDVVVPKGVVRDVTSGKRSSRIRLTGLDSQLDVQWRSHSIGPASAQPLLQAETSILVNITEDSVVLTAWQRVQPLPFRGNVEEIRVRLPAGFDLLATTGKYVQEARPEKTGKKTKTGNKAGKETGGRLYRVTFSEPRGEWTEIRWTLERKFPSGGGRLSLEGFDVQDAKVQTGEVAVLRAPGLRVERAAEGQTAVHRIRPADITARDLVRDLPVSGAYRFRRQPFRLNLDVSRLQSHVTANPQIRLFFTAKEVSLKADFRLVVSEDGGPIDAVQILWPGWRSEGWSIEPLEPSPVVAAQQINRKDDRAPLVLRLAERRSGTFTVTLRAKRHLSEKRPAVFQLPRPVVHVSQPTMLSVAHSANVDVELTDWEDVRIPEIHSLRTGGGEQADHIYRVDPAGGAFTARVTVHPQQIRAESEITLTPKLGGVEVRQQMTYRIEYEPVSAVSVHLPAELADLVQFFGQDGQPLESQSTMSAEEGVQTVEFPGLPTLGDVRVVATWFVQFENELHPGETAALSLPVLRPVKANISRTRVRLARNPLFSLSLSPEEWRQLLLPDGSALWVRENAPRLITARFHYPLVPRSRAFLISRAVIRAVIDSAGAIRYRAQYRLAEVPPELVLFLPRGVQLDAIWLGRKKQTSGMTHRKVRQQTVVQVPLQQVSAADRSAELLLTVDYHALRQEGMKWWSRHEFVAPQFPENIWVEETFWQLRLPPNHHLCSYDPAFLPGFRWRPSPVVWSRQPLPPCDNLDRWIGSEEGPAADESATGNVYSFRRFGSSESLTITSLSRSFLVLVGAGFAWLLGILLAKVPALRNLFTLLTGTLLMAVVGLWYAEELKLLLQPALLGAGLAVGFVGIERVLRRRRMPLLTTATPDEFVLNVSSSSLARYNKGAVVGSEDPTAHRLPSAEAQPVSSSTADFRREG